jgi:YbbR domain-containing protein
MNRSVDRNGNGPNGRFSAAAEIARGSVLSLYQHWAMALFSLVAAFAIWFVIQDVENPIVQANFPGEGQSGIPVEPTNVEDATPNEPSEVRIEVEGREDDLKDLSLDDFVATVDLKGLPVNTPTEAPVRVRSLRDGVRVLSVTPSRIQLTLEPIEEQAFPVSLNTSGQLAAGLAIEGAEVDPVGVTVRGLRESLQLVKSVDLDVNLSALREGETPIEGELRARSLTGDIVEVTISPARAAVTYTVAQNFVQRSLPVRAPLTGQLAPGFRIGSITVEPPVLSATGPRNQLDGRTELLTEAVNIGGATSEVRLVRNVELIDNVSFERRTVTVRIEVKAIECGTGNTSCPAFSFQVAPGFSNPPAGLFAQGGVTVTVRLAGPLPELQKVNPRDITATVNLGAPVGNGLYPVSVTVPANLSALGVRAEQPDPVAVTLGPNP